MKRLINIAKQAHSDSLYRNSLYLMASTYIMAFIGFFFWMIVTRLYSAEDVGIATTLISVTGLVTSFSMFGLNTALIRFLPGAKNKNAMISTVFTLISIGTIVMTVIFLTGLPVFSPRLTFILTSPVFMLSFTVFMVVASLNGITDSVFIANRDTKYIPLTNTVMSMVKLVLPVFLVGLGAYGIFYSFVFSVNVAMVMSIFLLTLVFGYRFLPRIDLREVKKLWRFSFGNYIAGIFGTLPSMIMPIIITNTLGPKVTAYYFMPSMIITVLIAIPRSFYTSFFAEGSHMEANLKSNFIRSIKSLYLLLGPLVLFTILFGKYILLLFGKEYSTEGIVYLQLVCLAVLFGAPNILMGAVLNVKKKIKSILFISILGTILTLTINYIFLSKSLVGLGFASIITSIILLFIQGFFIYYHFYK